MKNRTGSKWASAGLAAVLLAGVIMSCTGEPAGVTAAGAETGGIVLTQTAVWTDRENRKGAVTVEATGLKSLYMVEQNAFTGESEQNADTLKDAEPYAEEPSGEAAGFSDEGITEYEGVMEYEGITEYEGTAEYEAAGEYTATDAGSRHPVFVMYLSEYFLLDESEYTFPEGCSTREIPVTNQEGRETTITCISCPVGTEDSWRLTIPVTLRQEYRYPAAASAFPVSQDAPLEKSGEMGAFCASGTFIMEEREGTAELLAYAEPALLELDAARADFSVALSAQQEEAKAGQRLSYQVTLENTGEITLENIRLTAELTPMELEPLWENENNLIIEDRKAIVTRLTKGEIKTLTFSVKPEEDQSGAATAAVTASAPYPGQNGEANDPFADGGMAEVSGEPLIREASLPVVITPLRASFTVDKRADCEEAGPGDTITYQICIRNTGERTLHSVISTERFLHSSIRAQFEEKEGVELNGTKTQARIPQIPPGDCVNLKARVMLPQTMTDQKLVNQVIVVTDETGESQAVRSQAEVEVKAEPTGSPAGAPYEGNEAQSFSQTSRTSPKTGDSSHRELFEALLLCSLFFSAAASVRLFSAWRRGEKGKRKH